MANGQYGQPATVQATDTEELVFFMRNCPATPHTWNPAGQSIDH